MLINKQRIKNIVNRYYQEVYDIQGTTTIKVFEENVGYGMSETKDCIVKIIFKAKRMILFEETTYEQEIDEEKLSTIFSYFLEKENHTLKSLKFNKGIESKIEGYRLGEHLVNYPYFKGTDIEINEKVKKIGENNMEDIKNLKMYKGMLIVVDMVNGFVTEGALHDTDIGDIIPRQIELIKEAKNQGKLIVFIKDTHTINSTEFNRFGGKEKGAHCVKGTREQELVDEMKEYENDPDTIVIEKNSTSYMEAPDFRLLLEYQKALEEIWVIGCCTDICIINGTIPMSNYFDQWNREVIIKVFEDAIATYGEAARQEYVKASKLLMEQQGIELVKKKVK